MLELKSPQERPKRSAREAPRAPRGRQETPRQRREAPRERQDAPRRAQERFWEPSGVDFGPPGTPKPSKTIEKTRVLKNFVFFQRRRKKRPKELPKEAPRSAPGAARSGPRGAKTAPGAAKSDPGAPQEPPKRRTKGAKKAPVVVSALGVGSGGLREPF